MREISLGQRTDYSEKYNSDLLVAVSRAESRARIGKISYQFSGVDIWNAYEFSFLEESGKPFSSLLQIGYDCNSESIVESKSLKLYLNSFSQEVMQSEEALQRIKKDLQDLLQTSIVFVKYRKELGVVNVPCGFVPLDKIQTQNFIYDYDPTLLKTVPYRSNRHSLHLYSDLLKSNCRFTKQPDWGSVFISYTPKGKSLVPKSVLKYIVSYRQHNEFHEECCERIFFDIYNLLDPKYLRIECQYTRRGGIDINPVRQSSGPLGCEAEMEFFTRTSRQ